MVQNTEVRGGVQGLLLPYQNILSVMSMTKNVQSLSSFRAYTLLQLLTEKNVSKQSDNASPQNRTDIERCFTLTQSQNVSTFQSANTNGL